VILDADLVDEAKRLQDRAIDAFAEYMPMLGQVVRTAKVVSGEVGK
jgi:hypothetical protein